MVDGINGGNGTHNFQEKMIEQLQYEVADLRKQNKELTQWYEELSQNSETGDKRVKKLQEENRMLRSKIVQIEEKFESIKHSKNSIIAK